MFTTPARFMVQVVTRRLYSNHNDFTWMTTVGTCDNDDSSLTQLYVCSSTPLVHALYFRPICFISSTILPTTDVTNTHTTGRDKVRRTDY